jgi:hypothetical protein
MRTYRSGRALALVSIALVFLYTVVRGAFAEAGAHYLMSRDVEVLSTLDHVPFWLPGALYVSAGIVFLSWVHRSVANLHVLGQYEASPSSAVWAFLIPFVNLVQPHTVMAMVWRESQPAPVNPNGYRLARSTALVSAWWLTFVIASLFSRFSQMRAQQMMISDLDEYVYFVIAEGVLWVFAGVMFVWMVFRTQSRQDAQWQDMELRRNAPKPDPMKLR